MQSLRQFAASFEQRMMRRIKESVNDVTIGLAVTLVNELGENTPVDTSKAISNWQASYKLPKFSTLYPHFHGTGGSTYSVSLSKTVGDAAIALLARRFGEEVFIFNNAEYIEALEAGSSQQAPSGFLYQSILAAKRNRPRLEFKK